MDRLDSFVAFSSEVTAHTPYDLRGTGLAQDYLDAVDAALGFSTTDELLAAYAALPGPNGDLAKRKALMRQRIFGDAKLGPIARNVIKLWYIGIWFDPPRAWTDAFGARTNASDRMISGAAYAEGLIWSVIGAHPPGAKAPGYGSWVGPPRIPPIPDGI